MDHVNNNSEGEGPHYQKTKIEQLNIALTLLLTYFHLFFFVSLKSSFSLSRWTHTRISWNFVILEVQKSW